MTMDKAKSGYGETGGRMARTLTLMLMAATAGAQAPQPLPAPIDEGTTGNRLLAWLTSPPGMIIIGVFVLVVLIGIILTLLSKRTKDETDDFYSEPELESSKFEQLLAEIQGLYLRVQGGESKGYYRKIEELARIFLERTGHPGARQMSDEELQTILSSAAMPQKQAAMLTSIFERCRQGAEHEGQKIDFAPADLLKDLRQLVKQTEEMPSKTSS